MGLPFLIMLELFLISALAWQTAESPPQSDAATSRQHWEIDTGG